MDFDEIAEQQGWNDQSVIAVLRSFISQAGLQDDLINFAQEWADDENDDAQAPGID